MRDHGGSLAGSYRSYSGFPMREFLNDKSIKKYTQYSVGHEFAGGIGLKSVNLEKLKKVFNEKLEGYEFESKIVYDLELDANDVTPSLIKDIEKFDYLTGEGFPVATILVKDLFVEENPKVLGKTKETVKIKCDGIDVIKFKVDEDWANDVGVLDSIEVIGQLKLNNWQNWKKEIITTMQIVADDYRLG
jgi:single-stranded-DNA-specific exonuclease